MMLDEPDNSKNLLYPLDCFRDLSYSDWLEYKEEMDELKKERIKRQKGERK